jgi:CHAT domain-containing protein
MRRHEDELVAALATLQTRQADYVSLQGVSTADLAQMPPRLGPHEVLLEYYLLGDDVMAFIVTDGTVRVYGPLTSRARVEDLVQRWWFHLAHFRYGSEFVRRHDASLRATALDVLRSLHTSIIAPLEADLEGRTVVLVPHGPLHHVPFHALHDGHRFMIERHAISYAPSATVLTLQRVGATARDGTLIVGVPTPALPHIIEEVAAVKACHSDAHVLVGAEATRARVVAAAAGCRRIHLATHAVFRADNPIFSAVQLGDDWLTVSDIYNLDLAADLVVLSGCDTGTSVVHQGDELIGLTRGFLYAGARALVVSLWAVSDAATADLMRTFYQSLAGGSDACQALRLAQREAMVRNPHPYYWAPFIAWGQCTTASARDVPDTHG